MTLEALAGLMCRFDDVPVDYAPVTSLPPAVRRLPLLVPRSRGAPTLS
jgi:hypothetical protein